MSEQIREQISAFLDGELPRAQTELLLRRLTREAHLRECFGRYALIGEASRAAGGAPLSPGFAARINRAIEAQAPLAGGVQLRPRRAWLWRHAASGAVAAGVAVLAVLGLQQRADTPTIMSASGGRAPLTAARAAGVVAGSSGAAAGAVLAKADHEALSYTVPTTLAQTPAALAPARLTNYVFAHSEYTSFLGQRNLLSGLIAEPAATFPPAASALAPANAATTGAAASAASVQPPGDVPRSVSASGGP
ncbi:MAG TPA: sigma-E factor negative regulatory protein [Steroidobacteraceae bacterium]|nr:sigma-E factor negative regulatory protein [Steroidobacteraceae bacterium]